MRFCVIDQHKVVRNCEGKRKLHASQNYVQIQFSVVLCGWIRAELVIGETTLN